MAEGQDFSDLERGRCYRIQSRNLLVGAFINHDGRFPLFIGLREKFGAIYPSIEYGWFIEETLPDVVPDGIDLVECFRIDGRLVENKALADFLADVQRRSESA